MALNRGEEFAAGAFARPASEREELLLAVTKLRNSAVHRVHTSTKGIVELIDAAIKVAEAVSDEIRASQLQKLHNKLEEALESEVSKKNVLKAKLTKELAEIECQRKELAEREERAIQSMVDDDKVNTNLAGSDWEELLPQILCKDSVGVKDGRDDSTRSEDNGPADGKVEDGTTTEQATNTEETSQEQNSSIDEQLTPASLSREGSLDENGRQCVIVASAEDAAPVRKRKASGSDEYVNSMRWSFSHSHPDY